MRNDSIFCLAIKYGLVIEYGTRQYKTAMVYNSVHYTCTVQFHVGAFGIGENLVRHFTSTVHIWYSTCKAND